MNDRNPEKTLTGRRASLSRQRLLISGMQSMGVTIRINRFLAAAGLGSRRKVEDLVSEGRVTVNGQLVKDLALQVDPEKDHVRVGARTVKVARRIVYIVLHKPVDFISTSKDPKGRRNVFDLMKGAPNPIFSVGRLDRMSEGLLLFTNDGQLAHRLAHPRYQVPRTYRLRVAGEIDDRMIARFRRGVMNRGRLLRPKEVNLVHRGTKTTTLEIVLIEGQNREIRRMSEELGWKIEKLRRICYGPVSLRGIPVGEWRYLREDEIVKLRKAVRLGVE